MNNNNDPSRNIPEGIKREVRQRCGFGCVICGFPLYDYDHMEEWAKVHEHIADDITLLCPEHHRQVTTGLLPRSKVKQANENPFNITQGHSTPLLLHYEGNSCEFVLAGNTFTMEAHENPTRMIPVMVDGIPLLNFVLDKGHLLLNVILFDEYNRPILHIENNELIYSIESWDIQIVGKVLTIREKKRKIFLNMTFEAPNKVIIDKARLLCNGVEILVKEKLVFVGNNKTSIIDNEFHNCVGGLVIANSPLPFGCGILLEGVSRYQSNSQEVERLAREILREFAE